jgi:hypothetical protein
MIKLKFVFLFLISNGSLFGQFFNRYGNADTVKIFAIDDYAYKIDLAETKFASAKFVLDSIHIKVKKFSNKLETISFFNKSKSILKIDFYINDCGLAMARVKEPSPKFDDLAAYSNFYFENDSIFYSDYYFGVRMCMAIPRDRSFSEVYGYNPNLNGDNLKKYVKKLFTKLKTAGNMGLPASWGWTNFFHQQSSTNLLLWGLTVS